MENSCFELEINNKDWLAMGEWHNAQAACVLAQIDYEKHWERDFSGHLRLKHHLAQKYFGTIKTWTYGFSKLFSAPPLWYINKAIEERLLNIPEALLWEVKEYIETRLPEDRNKLLERYGYLAQKLMLASQEAAPKDLSANEQRCPGATNSGERKEENAQLKGDLEPQTEAEKPAWIIETIKIADKIALKRWKSGIQEITARNICDEVAEELNKERKNWGKKGPRTGGNIRKFALNGWQFNPPKEKNRRCQVEP